jgi:hypothetical protein
MEVFMRVAVPLSLITLVLAGLASAQFDSMITGSSNPVVLFDSSAGKVVSLIPQARTQSARGAMFGPDGFIYMSAWTTNGIDVLNPAIGQWITWMQVTDPTNYVMGCPYQPCPNYDNVGGFGIFCVDGYPAPATLNPPANSVNTFLVDYSGVTTTVKASVSVDGFFPRTNFPMSDMIPNPHGAGFLAAGFSTSDLKVDIYPLATNPPAPITLTNVATLPTGPMYDATLCEDGKYYVLGSGQVFIVDTQAKSYTSVDLAGFPTGATYGAIWAADWEQPGMKGHIAFDINDKIYSVDLLAAPMVVTQVTTLGRTFSVNTGRSAGECQLCSWLIDNNGKRNFHLNFGPAAGSMTAYLAPSITGYNPNPLIINTLEIHLAIDPISLFGLAGYLPYVPVTVLNGSGESDIAWNGVGFPLNLRAYWQAVVFSGSTLVEVSNIINVGL